MIITQAPSPNFNKRNKKIEYLVLHYTGTPSAKEALDLLNGCDPEHQVSAHYFIHEDGTIIQMVDENHRAWHAGISFWNGEEDLNCTSIGIEIQNAGHDYGYKDFPKKQINSVINLCQNIIKRHDIKPYNVLAHSDIAPDRKQDPGELFPWKKLAQNNIGLWHNINDEDKVKDEKALNNNKAVKLLLVKYGYSPKCDLKILITSFQRHFEPEIFLCPERIGSINLNTIALLNSLIRIKQD